LGGAGKDGVVACAANGFEKGFGRGESGVKGDGGSVGYEVDASGLDAGSGIESGLDVLLAGGASHPKDGECEGLRCCCGHLIFQSCWITCFGEGGEGGSYGGGGLGGGETGRADTDFFHFQARCGSQSLADAPDTGTAVHVVNAQGEFGQCWTPVVVG